MKLTLPGKVLIVDVGPRDGLQNESVPVGTGDKISLVNNLSTAGLKRIEVTSFVNPKVVPQMADAEAVMSGISRRPGVEYACLVANERGLGRALAARADLVNFVVVASETFNQRNARMSVRESLDAARATHQMARAHGTGFTAVIGASFHCPFEGETPMASVLSIVDALVADGLTEITLADTNGKADPKHVAELTDRAISQYPSVSFGIHLHDTRGMGMANAIAFLQAGGRRIESSLGGIGGCPFAPGATGNASTEDLVYMLQSMGVDTGISLGRLIDASQALGEVLGKRLDSRQLALSFPSAAQGV